MIKEVKQLSTIFFRGFVTLVPIAATIYIVTAAVQIVDSLLGDYLRQYLPTYIPGLGIISIVVIIFVFGLMLNNIVTGKLLGYFERKLLEVPYIRAVYSPLRDLMNLFSKKNQSQLKHVVLVSLTENGVQAIGLMTRENFSELKIDSFTKDRVAVYLPFSYALGGYTVLIPKSKIQVLDLPVEKAMSLAITAWIKAEN